MRDCENKEKDTHSTPRWVKVSGIIVIVLVVLFVIIKLTGIGGDHGPGRHFKSAGPYNHTPSIELEQGVKQL